MRRLSLSTKLFAAALPLVVAVGALLAVTVRSDLDEIQRAENGAELGRVWGPLITALNAVEAEVGQTAAGDAAANAAARRTTDQAVNDLRGAIDGLGAAEAAQEHITGSRSWLSAARRNLDMAAVAPEMQTEVDPDVAYESASRELVSVGQLLPSEAGDPALGRELLGVVKLAEAKLAANIVTAGTSQWPNPDNDRAGLLQARSAFTELDAVLSEFVAIAPEAWATQYRQSGFTPALASFRSQLDGVIRAADRGEVTMFDTESFNGLVNQGVQFQSAISSSIVDRATTEVDTTRRAALIRIGIILGAVLLASLVALYLIRSITRRIKAVSASATRVANEQLPALVEAIRDPRGRAVLPEIEPVDTHGGDEIAELADSFNSLQVTLVDVASEQVEVLRRGVSDIFVTMARRNRSLIDRQLAMLDEFEAEVDDPDVLSNYYQLDHMATRMRRNSESLLVLANAEPKRRRVKATEIDDVVRAAIGEVEEYRRIDIEALESLQVRGNVVADISHLLAELLDNATSFSPPDSQVRVGGRRTGDSYMLRVVDSGVGIGPERLRELNELLRHPPVVGLAVESTLGMSVVSLLANKHGIEVTLSAGNPGLTVDVVLPASLFGPIDTPRPGDDGAAALPTLAPNLADEHLVAWNDAGGETGFDGPPASDETFEPTAEPAVAAAEEPSWESMGIDLDSLMGAPGAAEDAPAPVREPITFDMGDPAPTPEPITFDMGTAMGSEVGGPGPELAEPVEPELPAGSDLAAPTSPAAPARPDVPTLPDAAPVDASPPPPPPPAAAQVAPPGIPAPPPPHLPPLPAAARGEFDTPPAPPMTADGLTRRPVSPATARPAPKYDPTPPTPSLPTRSPGRGPEGPDRLADLSDADERPVASGGEPSALQAALAAFDAGRRSSGGSLPTRTRVGDPVQLMDEPPSIAPSRLDPDALRERLRAFQTEFRTGHSGPDDHTDPNTDLGGDRR